MLANRTGIFLSLSALHQSIFMDFIYSWLESARAQGESGLAAASTDLFCGANWFNLGDESTGLPGTVLPKPCALEMTAETACPRGFPSAVDAQSSARRGQDEAEGAHGAGLRQAACVRRDQSQKKPAGKFLCSLPGKMISGCASSR